MRPLSRDRTDRTECAPLARRRGRGGGRPGEHLLPGLCLAARLVLRGGKAKTPSAREQEVALKGSMDARSCAPSPLSAAFRQAKARRCAVDEDDSQIAETTSIETAPRPATIPMLLSSGSLNAPETGAYLPVKRKVRAPAPETGDPCVASPIRIY